MEGLGSMSKFRKISEDWGILLIFSAVTVVGVLSIYIGGKEGNWLSKLYAALDTASAVALAILAFYAYHNYSKEKKNTKRFLEQLEKIDSLNNKSAFVGIQFGGGNKQALLDMKKFANDKNIDDSLVLLKDFGDKENNKVSPGDISKLEQYLKNEVMPMLSAADNIHLVVSGAGIAYYVCADVFSNWKPIIVYHRNNEGKYEKWATDNKHREKVESALKVSI